ncbi:hypothetical protein [uncultured Martelella sp.]|uniref:hypothetical protein n=1 Tax=uncultured Martelella sp. TaxID=392331 RepID=UPI0029C8A807|nr:hypothetical protein [uncultured Martelella sp.]
MAETILALTAALSAFARSTSAMVAGFALGALYIAAAIAVTLLVFRLFSRKSGKARRLPTTAKAVHPDGKEKAR